MPTLKILIVDDYAPVRRMVRLILQLRNDLEIIGEASDGLEAVQKAEELRPDLILLDIDLPTSSCEDTWCHEATAVNGAYSAWSSLHHSS